MIVIVLKFITFRVIFKNGNEVKNENFTAHQRIFRRLYQCQSNIFSTFLSKIAKYNRVPLGFYPSIARP